MSAKQASTVRTQNSVPSHPGSVRQSVPPKTTAGTSDKTPSELPKKEQEKAAGVGGFDPNDVFSDDDDDDSNAEEPGEEGKSVGQQKDGESTGSKELKIDPKQLKEKEAELKKKAQGTNKKQEEIPDVVREILNSQQSAPPSYEEVLRENEYITVRKGPFGTESATINDAGVISAVNIKNFTFEYGDGSEKTDSIESSNRSRAIRAGKKDEYIQRAQIATRDTFVVYPNGDKSTNIAIEGCVLVTTKPEAAGTESKYGTSYVKVGIPKPVVDKMMKRAKESGFNAALKTEVQSDKDYYWMFSDCEKAPSDAVSYVGVQDGNVFTMRGSIDDAVTGVRLDDETALILGVEMKADTNFLATMEFKLNMSFSRSGRGAPLDVTNITYSPSFKLREIVISDITTVTPPPFYTAKKTRATGMDISKHSVGAAMLARITSRMKLGGGK